MENYVECKNCKHFDGKMKCTLFCEEVYPDYTRKCSEFKPARVKCGDCIHFANRDCPVGNGNATADDECECPFFYLSSNGGKMVTDNVNSPAHYNQGGVECIEALKAALGDKFIGFLVGNVLKYCWRYQHKNGLEDLRKAQYYLNRAIEEMSNEQPVP